MLSLFHANIIIFLVEFFQLIHCENEKIFLPCFPKTTHVEIEQFDRRITLDYINCTRLWKKNLFTITFQLQRHRTKFDQIMQSNMVVTLFSGPCSSSTATLNIGRTFPSIHGTLDGSTPSTIASSHLSWNSPTQQGTISYEYFGSDADYAQLISALIHLVIRYGREEMIKGIYVMKFHNGK